MADYGTHIGAVPRLPLCRGCTQGVRSGIPAEIHLMTLGLSEPAAIARASVLRTLLTRDIRPKRASAADICYEILQRAVWRLESELHHHRCEAEESADDTDAIEQITAEIQHTRWLLGAAEMMLQAAEHDAGEGAE